MERLSLSPDRLRKARAEQLARVRAHGIRVVTGVDAGASPPKHHGMVWMATLQLLEAGYPLAEALTTATSQAADACGLGAETGRLRAGLAADLLVVDGDLRADPAALGRPTAVVVRGARVSL
jgi:imidazolonepropionase-like amidohydrolase